MKRFYPAAAALLGLAVTGLVVGGSEPDPTTAVLDPGLLHRQQGVPLSNRLATSPSGETGGEADGDWVDVLLVGAGDPEYLRAMGARLGTKAGDIQSARIPLAQISALTRVPGLRAAQLARPMSLTLDVSLLEIGAQPLRERNGADWSGATGSGVVVGLVDSGLDWTHPDFQHADGSTRILHFWDQTSDAGSPPRTGPDTLYHYGTEWSAADIDNGIAQGGDPVGHGTHVAGIAAGNGSGSEVDSLRYLYAGVAPQADLIVVGADLFLETGILDAVAYIFTRAAEAGKPAVINLSLGTQFGPHDGTAALDEAIDNLTGPGRLVVAAAGNDGITQVHAEAMVPLGGADSVTVFVPFYNPNPFFNFFSIDAFYREPANLEITLVTPLGARWGPYPLDSTVSEELTGEGTLFFAHLDTDPVGNNLQIQFDISDFNPDTLIYPTVPLPANGNWRIVLSDAGGSSTVSEVDLWMAASTIIDLGGLGPRFTDGYDPSEEITSPGSAGEVITVGAYNTKRCWPDSTGVIQCTSLPQAVTEPGRIAYFSSHGPTRDDRNKPELVAPGFVIASAQSRQMTPAVREAYQLSRTLAPDRRHFVFAGTSMSAPHVTGTLALLLEREPNLTPTEARARLVETIRTDAFTGPDWDPSYGFGKLDAGALLDTTVVPVQTRDLRVAAGVTGAVVDWQADPADGISAFRLHRRLPAASWAEAGRYSGPGPHRYLDPTALPGTGYRVWSLTRDGHNELWAESTFHGETAGFRLGRAFPNPFRSSTRISWTAPDQAREITAAVFDVAGRRIRTWRMPRSATTLWLEWDGHDANGREVPPGVYWMRFAGVDVHRTVKLIRLP